MIDFFQSRAGSPAASFNGVLIHSRYDPHREAERFVAEHLKSGTNGSVIIFGAGLGYLPSVIEKLQPRRKIISVYFHSELYRRSVSSCKPAWYPGCGSSLLSFFSDWLVEDDALDLAILEWAPCISLFSGHYQSALSALKTILERLNGNIVTTSYFGKKWLRNSIRNFILLHKYVVPEKTQLPVIIAASGPSLEDSIDLIIKYRASVMLVSVPSALSFLLHHNCRPDILVCTDPGYWAHLHIEYMNSSSTSYCAMPLSAAGEVYRKNVPIALLMEGKPWEKELLSGAGLPQLYIPENGTVSGSALEYALAVSTGPIIFAGLDFSYADIRSHVKPNGFDSFLSRNSSRLHPEYSDRYVRAVQQAPIRREGLRLSRPLNTYREWFSARAAAESRTIYRLLPTSLPCTVPAADSEILASYTSGTQQPRFHAVSVPRVNVRKKLCTELLDSLLLRSHALLTQPSVELTGASSNTGDEQFTHRFLRTIDTPSYNEFLRALRSRHRIKEKAESLLSSVERTVNEIKERIN